MVQYPVLPVSEVEDETVSRHPLPLECISQTHSAWTFLLKVLYNIASYTRANVSMIDVDGGSIPSSPVSDSAVRELFAEQQR